MKIINFKASNFKGDCFIDEDFSVHLELMNKVLVSHNMLCVITSSGRLDTNVKGAIVDPAKMGNHLVYHAIDFNLINKATNEYYNSTKLGDGTGLDEVCCRDIMKVSGLTWGEIFNHPDSVHFDDRLNVKDPAKWQELYNELHNEHTA